MNQYSNGKLYIKKRSFSEWLILVVLVFPFLFGTLFEIIGLPSFVRFTIDAVLVYFLVLFIYNKSAI